MLLDSVKNRCARRTIFSLVLFLRVCEGVDDLAFDAVEEVGSVLGDS